MEKDKMDKISEMWKSYNNTQSAQSTGCNHLGTYSQNFQNLMPLAMQVASRTVGIDLVAVKPINMPVGQISYMDFEYADKRKEAIEELLRGEN